VDLLHSLYQPIVSDHGNTKTRSIRQSSGLVLQLLNFITVVALIVKEADDTCLEFELIIAIDLRNC